MPKKTPTRHGFTLIEMAVVLVIIGVVLAVSLPFFSDLSKRSKRSAADDYLKKVKDQVIGFALSKSPPRLPTYDEFKNMGVGQDPFGNNPKYIHATGLDTGSTLCNAATTPITVEKDSASQSTSNVAFVLIAHGQNMKQEVNYTSGTSTYRYYARNYKTDNATSGQDYDDAFQFATLNELKTRVCAAASSQDAPMGSDVSFAANLADGCSFVPQTAAQTAGKNAIRINAETGEVELGANEDNAVYACLWYTGTFTGKCTDGICDWPADGTAATLRAYFLFTFKNADSSAWSTDYGDGFTFSIATANNGANTNTIASCGNSGQYMGYAGAGASTTGVVPPKFGVEIDTRGQRDVRDPEYYDNTTGTPDYKFYNHVAIVMWNDYQTYTNSDNYHYRSAGLTVLPDLDVENTDFDPVNAPNAAASEVNLCDGYYTTRPDYGAVYNNSTWYGQEMHPARTNPSTYTQDPSNATYYADGGPFLDYQGGATGAIWDASKIWFNNGTSTSGTNGATWLEDGQPHSFRIEIARDANDYTSTTCYTSTATGRRQTPTSRKYVIKVWVDSTAAGRSDLTADLGVAPDIQQTVYLVSDSTFRSGFSQFLFGWTYGHAANVESGVILSDFGIKFDW